MGKNVWPHNADAELSLIGCMLLNNDIINEVASILDNEDFYLVQNQDVFKWLKKASQEDKADTVSLMSSGLADESLAVGYMDKACDVGVWQSRAMLIKKEAIRRKLIVYGRHIERRANTPEWEITPANIVAISDSIRGICPDGMFTSKKNPLDGLERYIKELKSMGGVRFGTGIPNVDCHMAGGILPGQAMGIVGAQGSMKTSLALQGAKDYIRRSGRKVLYLCMDPSMSQDEIRNRLIQAKARMDNREIVYGLLNETEEVFKANEELKAEMGDKLLVIEGPQTVETVSAIVAIERPGAVIYDYLSAMGGFRNDYELANTVMTALNELAKKYKFVNVFLHQMSRTAKIDQRNGNFGNHGKGGGAIEERVHVELELAKYNAPDGDDEHKGWRMIAFTKNRNGDDKVLLVNTIGYCMTFLNEVEEAHFEPGRQSSGGWKVKCIADF